ncbi:AraC family transcriptional regulator [Pectobacterium betavasculorum]|uniref:AraC family transcriptional regulator n=1 Tax=Pectobacterium betavasculorum TaxID=55207 RepID=A0ABR4V200_9GAMM|nr:AraC family transcriptional regulator [Pectobacterium betavasculorum]KFX21143.1 AraC family transcriptional regulator [Pectobacterium betavasculorum]
MLDQNGSAALALLVAKTATTDGDYETAIPALSLYRRSAATAPMPCIYGLGLGITVQGGKRVTLRDKIFDYGPGQSLVTSVDLPVVSHVTKASTDEPYLGIRLNLDARLISQLVADMDFSHTAKTCSTSAISVVELDESLLEAICRLIRLLNDHTLLPHIAPLIQQEITARLLHGQHGPTLRPLVTQGSPGQQIAKVLSWLKLNFTQDLSMEELAAKAYMSPSAFRQHFRSLTDMSPLQYLKNLRLQEARQLMMNESLDASSAAVRVGYESASQFSREYTRLFGAPPLRDMKQLRKYSSSK